MLRKLMLSPDEGGGGSNADAGAGQSGGSDAGAGGQQGAQDQGSKSDIIQLTPSALNERLARAKQQASQEARETVMAELKQQGLLKDQSGDAGGSGDEGDKGKKSDAQSKAEKELKSKFDAQLQAIQEQQRKAEAEHKATVEKMNTQMQTQFLDSELDRALMNLPQGMKIRPSAARQVAKLIKGDSNLKIEDGRIFVYDGNDNLVISKSPETPGESMSLAEHAAEWLSRNDHFLEPMQKSGAGGKAATTVGGVKLPSNFADDAVFATLSPEQKKAAYKQLGLGPSEDRGPFVRYRDQYKPQPQRTGNNA